MDEPEKARKAIREVFHELQRRIRLLISLPIEQLDRPSLQREARALAERTASADATSEG